jgi:hypothetical protein
VGGERVTFFVCLCLCLCLCLCPCLHLPTCVSLLAAKLGGSCGIMFHVDKHAYFTSTSMHVSRRQACIFHVDTHASAPPLASHPTVTLPSCFALPFLHSPASALFPHSRCSSCTPASVASPLFLRCCPSAPHPPHSPLFLNSHLYSVAVQRVGCAERRLCECCGCGWSTVVWGQLTVVWGKKPL